MIRRRAHVILEGADCTGKTTLARRLERLGYDYRHEGPPPDLAPDRLLDHYAGALLAATRPTVFDRLYLGEVVYGPLLRGGAKLTPAHLMVLRRVALAVGAVTVLCSPPWAVVRAAWRRRRATELLRDEASLRASYDAYRRHRVWADFVTASLDPAAGWVREREVLPRPYVGVPTARYLLVGERSSGAFDEAFLSTQGSSRYLHEALERAGFKESELAFVNALRRDGSGVDLRTFPTTHRVIALGKVAAAACIRQDLPFAAVDHPQLWRRFHHHKKELYAAELRRLRDGDS